MINFNVLCTKNIIIYLKYIYFDEYPNFLIFKLYKMIVIQSK